MTFTKGYKQTPDHTAKIRAANLGQKRSPETVERIRASRIGSRATPETRAKLSAMFRTRTMSPEARAKIAAWNTGRLRPDITGPLNNMWKGGVWSDRHEGSGYYWWKKKVHLRDNNTCQLCGKTGLHGRDRIADHIIQWKDAPELRLEVSNGRTLCRECDRRNLSDQARRHMAERGRGRNK